MSASADPGRAALRDIAALRTASGWENACLRAARYEALLQHAFALAAAELKPEPPLPDLLVRGSLAHGVLSNRSDIDFEVSSARTPAGDLALEGRMLTYLRAAGVSVEGSAARPAEVDLHGAGGLTRDLHELLELRRPGSPRRDQGWLRARFAGLPNGWWNRRSAYERSGRQPTAKYAFFEIRALLARLSAREGLELVTTSAQLDALRERLAPQIVADLAACARDALALYEADAPPGPEIRQLQDRLQVRRDELGLAGPDLTVVPGVDVRAPGAATS